jgi:SAM-dependent methyltransferase
MGVPAPGGSADHLLSLENPERIAQVRDVFDRARYRRPPIQALLGGEAVGSELGPRDVPRMLRACGGDSPLEVLVRLFLIGVPVAASDFGRAVAPLTLDDWRALGLVETDGPNVVRLVEVLCSDELLLAQYAPYHPRPRPQSPVMRLNAAANSWELAQLTIRRPVAAALDLGTGSGLHALLAAAHSRRVVGVDCNARALNLAAFNAGLNGFAHVAFRAGDFFEPVAGETFDLVVSNPPFVISPEQDAVYRDSGLPGDRVCRQIMAALPRFLRPGGFGQVFINWAHVRGEDPEDRLRHWVAGGGCDAWVLRLATWDPAGYATHWMPPSAKGDWPALTRRFEAWMAYYEREGIEAISYGLITLRRRSGGPNWFVCEDAPERLGPCGEAIARGFARRDFLAALPDEQALLAARLRTAPELCWHQHARPAAAGWSVTGSWLQLDQGLAYRLQVDGNVWQLVAQCRGDRTFGSILTDLATSLGSDRDQVIPAGLDLARCLLEYGFLVPVAGEAVAGAGDLTPVSGRSLQGTEAPGLPNPGVGDFLMISQGAFQV